ncbi:hypothetical protein [Paraburkholderia sp. A1RO-1]|uniref:hypothetical protein n=1 Tax=unclassified Paraburkholderia TaxID=2615204 RepID=UPI003B827A86
MASTESMSTPPSRRRNALAVETPSAARTGKAPAIHDRRAASGKPAPSSASPANKPVTHAASQTKFSEWMTSRMARYASCLVELESCAPGTAHD